METENAVCATMQKYAQYANDHLMEIHCGVLPHSSGWVVFGNLGRSDKVDRFIELPGGSHETGEMSWNDEEGPTFALMVLDEDEPDLGQLWGEACGVYS